MSSPEAPQPPERPDLQAADAWPTGVGRPGSATLSQRPRSRWPRRTAIVLAVLLVTATAGAAGGFVGAREAGDSWESRYEQAVANRDTWKSQADRWRQTSEDLQESSDTYQGQSQAYQSKLRDLQQRIDDTVGNLDHPTFSLWNACDPGVTGCPLAPDHEYVGGVPDTFTYHINFRATVPVTVWIFDVNDFICWETRTCDWHAAAGWENRTSLENAVFHDAEGCAGYMAVFVSEEAGTLYPDIRVTRNPAPDSTGTCSESP